MEYRRLAALSEMKILLLELKRNLRFSAKPVRGMLSELNIDNYDVLDTFISALRADCDKTCFFDCWCDSLSAFNAKNRVFKDDEIKLLVSFGSNFGYGDTESQLELVDMTAEYFENFETEASSETAKRGKLKLMLPIYAGVVFCILMI